MQHYLDLNNTYQRLLDDGLEKRAAESEPTTELPPAGLPHYINLPNNQGYVNLPMPVQKEENVAVSFSTNNSNNVHKSEVEGDGRCLRDSIVPQHHQACPEDKSPRPMRKVDNKPSTTIKGKPGVFYVTNIPDESEPEISRSSDTSHKFVSPRQSANSGIVSPAPDYANGPPSRHKLTSDSDTSSGYWGENVEPPSYNVVMMGSSPPSSPHYGNQIDIV